MRRLSSRRFAVPVFAALLAATPGYAAFKRTKFGPFELVPTFSLEVRQHSNVYVSNDEVRAARATPTADVSGVILDFRPGVSILAKPNLEKKIRGLFFDLRYNPGISFFPSAPQIEIPCSTPGCTPERATPDDFKLVHNLQAGLRYQLSGRFNLSASFQTSSPELSQADLRFGDRTIRTGAKYDLNRTMSLSGSYSFRRFSIPLASDRTDEHLPLGSFDGSTVRGAWNWTWRPTLTLGIEYTYDQRDFDPFEPLDPVNHNDFREDGIPDIGKDYSSHSVHLSAVKRLARQARGTVLAGYTWRTQDVRQFGASAYNGFTGSVTIETLLTKRTRLQLSAEHAITDTVREVTLTEFNAFTTDQLGQFSVIPEQFSADRNQRYMIDLIQNVFRRGDQLLLGVAYQRDKLEDQLGGQNFFVPGSAAQRDLTGLCEVEPTPGGGLNARGGQFCRTVLANQENRLFLVTGGYRVRLRSWLGVQARATWFKGKAEIRPTDEDTALTGRQPKTVETDYFSFSGGLVVNLHVFQ